MVLGGPLECNNSTAPHTLSFITAAVSVLLMLITVPGNLLICMAVVKDPYQSLRTPFNLFLLNIAAADIIVGLGVLPLSIAYHTLEGKGMYHDALIKTLHLVFFISCSASVLGIAALSLDRFICVTSPLKYRLRLTSSRVKKVSFTIWLISVAGPFTYLYVDFIIYTFVFANTAILLTLVILLFVNHKISRSLQAQRKLLHSLVDGEIMKTKLMQRDERVTRTFLYFLGAFMILNLPAVSFSYVLNFGSSYGCNSFHIFRDFQFLSILFPSSVNPFIYSLRLQNFRNAIKVTAFKMMPNFVVKDSNASLMPSCSTEVLTGQSRRVLSALELGSVVNQVFTTKAIAKSVKNRHPCHPVCNHANFSNLQFDEETVKEDREQGISHFYRVTSNL